MFKNFLMASVIACPLFAQVVVADEFQDSVKKLYPEFKALVKKGADESSMKKFFDDHFDTHAISKSFCGGDSDKVVGSIVKFLVWRLKTEAIKIVEKLELDGNLRSVKIVGTTHVKTKLIDSSKTDNEYELIVIFANENKKVREIKVVGIPLIEGAKTVIKENASKNLNSLKKVDERASVIEEAINKFIKNNSK